MKGKRESEVTQLCPTLRDPMDCSLLSRQEYWSGSPVPSQKKKKKNKFLASSSLTGISQQPAVKQGHKTRSRQYVVGGNDMNSRLKHRRPESRPSANSSDTLTKEAMYSGWSTTLHVSGEGVVGDREKSPQHE